MSISLRLSAKELVVRGHIPEILQTIFEQALLSAEGCQWWSSREDIWSLLRAITSVSRAWYRLACDCPWLWRNISNFDVDTDDLALLKDDPYRYYRSHRLPEHMYSHGLFLKRAKAVPLRLYVSSVLHLLGMMKRMNVSQFENVEELIVELNADLSGEWLMDFKPEQHAIVLQRILNLPFPNLKALLTNHMNFDVPWFEAFLSKHSSIRSLILSDVCLEPSVHATEMTRNPTVLPNLKQFGIQTWFMDVPVTVFSVICAPNLRTVDFDLTEVGDGLLDMPPAGGRWRQWDSVQVLKVRGELFFGELQGLLLVARNIQILEIGSLFSGERGSYGPHDLVDARLLVNMLTVRNENPLRLPFLTTLRMDKDSSTAASAANVPFDELIANRAECPSVSPLVEIGLEAGNSVWDGWLARAAEFAGEVQFVRWNPTKQLCTGGS